VARSARRLKRAPRTIRLPRRAGREALRVLRVWGVGGVNARCARAGSCMSTDPVSPDQLRSSEGRPALCPPACVAPVAPARTEGFDGSEPVRFISVSESQVRMPLSHLDQLRDHLHAAVRCMGHGGWRVPADAVDLAYDRVVDRLLRGSIDDLMPYSFRTLENVIRKGPERSDAHRERCPPMREGFDVPSESQVPAVDQSVGPSALASWSRRRTCSRRLRRPPSGLRWTSSLRWRPLRARG
jgi:hypothetical protein